jgi:hypothetical protein
MGWKHGMHEIVENPRLENVLSEKPGKENTLLLT